VKHKSEKSNIFDPSPSLRYKAEICDSTLS
jgi:hypothetical protein